MNVTFEDQDHTLTLLAGFESLFNGRLDDKSNLVYLDSCLRLNGVDTNAIAGTESFVESVKQIGVKFYEFIKNFLKSIWDFFFGSKGDKRAQHVKTAVAAIDVAQKEIKTELSKAEPEVVGKVEDLANNVLEKTELAFNVAKLNDRFLINKDGAFTDIEKTAKVIGLEIPDLTSEFTKLMGEYDVIRTGFENHKVSKNGSVHGTVSSLSQAAFLANKFGNLRIIYNTINKKLMPVTEKANEMAKGYDKKGKDEDGENHYREARKVTAFLASLNNAIAAAQTGCDKNVMRIADTFNSMFIKLTYNSRTKNVLEELTEEQ